jgi:hypothetical protein
MTRLPAFRTFRSVLCACLLGAGSLAIAQTPPAPASNTVLSIAEIESKVAAQGITIKEIELRDLVVEIEGYDANGHEVELLVDRRSGEILSRKVEKK